MPNRILKESICTSDSVDSLSWFEEVLFYRLIVNCDDYGRFDGRPAIIKNRLFPLKESLTTKAISKAVNTLVIAGLVVLYEFEGKPYLYLPTWNDHQNVRAKRSKYPSPEGCVIAHENICNHMYADVPVIQSESESESKSKRDNAPAKHAYGEFDNVLLTDAELDKLKNRLTDWAERIERLSQYLKNKPKKHYESHYATILTWAAKDAKEDAERKQSATSRPNRQRDLCSSRAYSEAELDRMGHDLLGGD